MELSSDESSDWTRAPFSSVKELVEFVIPDWLSVDSPRASASLLRYSEAFCDSCSDLLLDQTESRSFSTSAKILSNSESITKLKSSPSKLS